MPPELANFLTLLQVDVQNFLNAYDAMSDRFQEAYDRDFDQLLAQQEYPLPGDLDHLTLAKLMNALAAAQAVQNTLTTNQRENIGRLLGVLRAWTR